MKSEAEVPVEELHSHIGRYEHRRKRRLIALWAGSAAACAALLLAVLLPRAEDVAAPAEPLLAAAPAPEPPSPVCDDAVPQPAVAPQAAVRHAENILPHPSSDVSEIVAAQPVESVPALPPLPDTVLPVVPPDCRVTDRLVAMGGTPQQDPRIIVTDRLVHISPPAYNTFRQAVVEPILALVTKDLD